MDEPKPFASLSPSLLARKGGARPAMRPQYQAYTSGSQFNEATARQLDEDLGWNDMGHDATSDHEHSVSPVVSKPVPAEVVALKPSVPLTPPVARAPEEPRVPEVVRQQAEIADRIAEPAAPPALVAIKPADIKSAEIKSAEIKSAEIKSSEIKPADRALDAARRSALADGRRAAFTLRLDAERHLKLRLACTISNRSAQQVVTDALDLFIASLPEVADLAAQVRKRG